MKHLKDLIIQSLLVQQNLTSKSDFVWDINSNTDIIIADQIMRQIAKESRSVQDFINRVQTASTSLQTRLFQKMKKQFNIDHKQYQQINNYLHNYVMPKAQIYGNKLVGSKKRAGSFDFQKYYQKFGK